MCIFEKLHICCWTSHSLLETHPLSLQDNLFSFSGHHHKSCRDQFSTPSYSSFEASACRTRQYYTARPHAAPHHYSVKFTPFLNLHIQLLHGISDMDPQQKFRFLDLPKEIRLMVYELLPNTITHRRSEFIYQEKNHGVTLVAIWRPTVVSCTCRMIHDEASTIVKRISRKLHRRSRVLEA